MPALKQVLLDNAVDLHPKNGLFKSLLGVAHCNPSENKLNPRTH